MTCDDCAAFHADSTERTTGECRRFAPRPDPSSPAINTWSWPMVQGDDWCLDHCVVETTPATATADVADLHEQRETSLNWLELTCGWEPETAEDQAKLAELRQQTMAAVSQAEEEIGDE